MNSSKKKERVNDFLVADENTMESPNAIKHRRRGDRHNDAMHAETDKHPRGHDPETGTLKMQRGVIHHPLRNKFRSANSAESDVTTSYPVLYHV